MREKRFYILSGCKNDIEYIIKNIYPTSYVSGLKSIEGIYTDSEEFEFLINESKKRNIELVFGRFEMEYSKKELDDAEFFWLNAKSYCSEYSEEYGTEFSYEDKCTHCGAGRTQISELYINKSKMGKKDISVTYDLEWVISEKLYHILNCNEVTGLIYGDVKHKKNAKIKNEPKLYQLKSQNILPKLNSKTEFYKEKFCTQCQQSGLFLKSLPVYSREILVDAKDFNYTEEYFGSGLAGKQVFIVSQKVYKIFKNEKIKGVSFDIVKII